MWPRLCIVYLYFPVGVDSVDNCEVRRNWFRGRYGIINNHLSGFDWEFEFAGLGVSDMFDRLKAVLVPLISRYVLLSVCPPVSSAWQSYKVTNHSKECKAEILCLLSRLRKFLVDLMIVFADFLSMPSVITNSL